MGEFFVGKKVKLLTGEECAGIRIWHMMLQKPELGHMACGIDDAVYFISVYRGDLVCQINQKYLELQAGEGLFINQKNAWRFTECKTEGCEFFLFEVCPEKTELENGYLELCQQYERFPFLRINADKELLSYLQKAGKIAIEKEDFYALELKGFLYGAWSCLCREYVLLSGKESVSGQKEARRLCSMLVFLHENYREKPTLEEMAKHCGVSNGEYCRFFKKHMGQTPVEYLQQYRIGKILPELLEKSGTITEIVLRHGFTGSSYFPETFRKTMGCTPGDYRKWYMAENDGGCPLRSKQAGTKKCSAPPDKRNHSMPAHLL